MASNLRNKIQRLAAQVCRREGHKSQARIHDVVEVIGIIEDIRYDDAEAALTLTQLGISRAKRRKKA